MSKNRNVFINRTMKIVNGLLLLLSFFAIVKTLFIGFDIDEGYAIAQSYRLGIGDTMFSYMWEPHQTSAFGSTIFILPYLLITGGSTTGIVLYLRIVGTIPHLLLGYWLYRIAKNRLGSTSALLLTFAHINFLPKWVAVPEFELMQYWGVCIVFLSLLSWLSNKKNCYLWFAGLGLFVSVMCYPTMVLLYPIYVVALFMLSEETCKHKWMAVGTFTAGVAIPGIALLIYLRSYMTVAEFTEYLSKIFMDESHSVSIAFRFSEYGRELGTLFGVLLSCLPEALVLTGVVGLISYLIYRKKAVDSANRDIVEVTTYAFTIKKYSIILLLFIMFAITRRQIWGCLLEDQNQFYLYFRYVVAILVGLLIATIAKAKMKTYLLLAVLPGIVGVFASALLTNMSLEISFARIYIGVIGVLFIAFESMKDSFDKDIVVKYLSYGVFVLFIGSLLVCKLVLVRVTGCIPVTVRMPLGQITEGPAAGIYVHKDLAAQYNENIPIIKEAIHAEDVVLYFGAENLYYLAGDATIASPSVQGTTVFNEMFFEYYRLHPERTPNVVIIDKNFEITPEYRYQYENHIVLDWIEKEFKEAKKIETNHLIILRK